MKDEQIEGVTEEQRRSNVLKLRKLAWDIKDREAQRLQRTLVWRQHHDPEELLRALATFAVREDD